MHRELIDKHQTSLDITLLIFLIIKNEKVTGETRDKMNSRPLTGWSLSFTCTYSLFVHERKAHVSVPVFLLCFYKCAFSECVLKKKRKKNQVQELKNKIFVSLNPSNHLELVNNLNFQLQPPLQALAFFGQYFIAKKYLGFIFLPKLSFIFPENVKGTSEWILLLLPVVLGQWGIVIMNKWFNSPVHPALLLLTQISKGFQDEKVLPIKAKASLESQRCLLSFSVHFEMCQSILWGYHM